MFCENFALFLQYRRWRKYQNNTETSRELANEMKDNDAYISTTQHMPLVDNIAYGQTTPHVPTQDSAAYICSQLPIATDNDPVYNVITEDDGYMAGDQNPDYYDYVQV